MAVQAVRYTLPESDETFDAMLRNVLVEMLLVMLQDSDMEIRRLAMTTLNSAAHNKPDLILLDLIMPKMSGEEFIKRIRSTAEHASIPLLVITSESVEDQIRQIAGSGRIGFAVKPLIPSSLLESVQKLIN